MMLWQVYLNQGNIVCDGAFIAIGHKPNTELFTNQLDIDDDGYNENYYESIDKKAELMKQNMSKLNKNQRRVIKMREIDKMSYQAIADKEKKNLNTIKSQIRNARIELINMTKEEFKKID